MVKHATFAALALTACSEVPRTYSTQANPTEVLFSDGFEREALGDAWHPTGAGARIEAGALVTSGLENHPVWLKQPLPEDVRIEFDAWTPSDEGDIKVELAGDGRSFATSDNYVASGYVVIFGGWNNTTNAIVRRNEHGSDRRTVSSPRVEATKRYRMTLTRQDGVLSWDLDGFPILTFEDAAPLRGPDQAHFAFSGWTSEVRFDNLAIEALHP